MNTEDYYLKIPTKYYVIWAIVIFALFVVSLSFTRKKVQEMDYLTYEKPQDTIKIESPVSDRGGINYLEDRVVSSKSQLVENNDAYDGWRYRSKVNPQFHTLNDLEGPYYMYKAANNDTIVVIKDGYVLKFLLPTPDTVSRRDRFWKD